MLHDLINFTLSRDTVKVYRASKIQEQFHLLHKLYSESSAYHIPSLFHITGDLDVKRLEASIQKVIATHDMLRTTFVIDNDTLYQQIYEACEFTLPLVDMGDNTNDDFDDMIYEYVEAPFDLTTAFPYRIALIKTGDEEYYLLSVFHHILIDLRSKDIFGEQLSRYYNNTDTDINDTEHQYNDYISFQDTWFAGNAYKKAYAFWLKKTTERRRYLELPLDYPRPKYLSLAGDEYPFDIDEHITGLLRTYSKEHSVTPFITLLSAYFILLYNLTKQQDICVGVPLSNRRREGLKNIFGPFVNTVPFYVDITDDMPVIELIGKVRKELLFAHRHQELPTQDIVQLANPGRNTEYNPVYQAGFTFEHPMHLSLDHLTVTAIPIFNGGSILDLYMRLWDDGNTISGRFEFNTDIIKGESVERYFNDYLSILHIIGNDAGATIASCRKN